MNIAPQQFKSTFKTLPYVLRSYITDEELTNIAESIGQKYGLHVDTVGGIYREATNMLMGFENPEQFTGELRSLGVAQELVGPIVQELNERVFVPLRKKMQEEGDRDPFKEAEELSKELNGVEGSQAASAVSAPPAPAQYPSAPQPVPQPITPPATPPPAPVVPQMPSYAQPPVAPAPSLSQFNQPFTAVPQQPAAPTFVPPAQTPRTPPVPANLPGAGVVTPATQTPFTSEAATVRTMAKDMTEIKAGTYEHHIFQPSQAPAPSVPAAHTPQFPAQPIPPPPSTPAPVRQAPPEIRAAPVVHAAPQPLTISSAPKTQNEEQLHQVLKQYGIDPYREPVE